MPLPAPYRVADLPQNAPTAFDFTANAGECAALADTLNLTDLRKLRLHGTLSAQGKRDWKLKAILGATVVQPCVVTLEAVTTRLDVPVTRQFIAGIITPDEPEVEMPEDESIEALGPEIDLASILREALALNLPLYPRKEGAQIAQANFTKPGQKAMTDEDVKPFAGLAALRDQMQDGGEKE